MKLCLFDLVPFSNDFTNLVTEGQVRTEFILIVCSAFAMKETYQNPPPSTTTPSLHHGLEGASVLLPLDWLGDGCCYAPGKRQHSHQCWEGYKSRKGSPSATAHY